MKTAIVYDRVNKWGGAERVLLALHEIFPEAPLYTSVYDKKKAKWAEVFPEVKTSFLQKIPFAKSNHELLAPLMPIAFEQLSLTGEFDKYDLVISVTSEAAKGIITQPNTFHLCYCLTPTRYLWSGYEEYFKNGLLQWLSKPLVKYLRNWDKIAAQRPDMMIAISTEVQNRIKKYYDRDSRIIYPPTNNFQRASDKLQTNTKHKILNTKYYLLVSRLVNYKKVDLAIEAFNRIEETLVIVGTGREESKMKSIAKENIIFTGQLTDEELSHYYKHAKALIFPQLEDFGLVSLEAQAQGTPVLAFGKGGALDTIVENETGSFFDEQSEDALLSALQQFDTIEFNKEKIIKNADRFSKEIFKKKIIQAIGDAKR